MKPCRALNSHWIVAIWEGERYCLEARRPAPFVPDTQPLAGRGRAASVANAAAYTRLFPRGKTGFLRAIASLMVACALIAGCERAEQPKKQQIQTATLAVTDDAQRAVTLNQPAKRIVSLMPTVTDLIIAMGHAGDLIARTDYDTDPRIAKLPSIGGGLNPSLEWVAARRPDLVISWPDHGSRSIVAQVNTIGVPIYAASTESIADAIRTIRNVGTLLGDSASADSLARSITTSLDSTRASVAQLRPVRVAYVLSIDPPTIAGPRTFIDELITIAGGNNIFADIAQSWPQVNLEEIVRRDPDVIIVARESGPDVAHVLEKLAGWRELRAVKAHHVYRVSPDYFNRSGPLMPRAARELAGFFQQAR